MRQENVDTAIAAVEGAISRRLTAAERAELQRRLQDQVDDRLDEDKDLSFTADEIIDAGQRAGIMDEYGDDAGVVLAE